MFSACYMSAQQRLQPPSGNDWAWHVRSGGCCCVWYCGLVAAKGWPETHAVWCILHFSRAHGSMAAPQRLQGLGPGAYPPAKNTRGWFLCCIALLMRHTRLQLVVCAVLTDDTRTAVNASAWAHHVSAAPNNLAHPHELLPCCRVRFPCVPRVLVEACITNLLARAEDARACGRVATVGFELLAQRMPVYVSGPQPQAPCMCICLCCFGLPC